MRHFMWIFIALLTSTLAEEYIIERQVHLIQGSWIDQPDTFMLPSSMCSGDISANCTAMGGTRINNTCRCSCNEESEFKEFYKSTFGYYENQWKCFENTKVRLHSGCQTIMNERQATIPLMTLPMVQPTVGHNIPGLTSQCGIIGGKYLECDGKWHQLNTTLIKSRFYLGEHKYFYYSISEPPTPTINGRVIRLEIWCTQPKKMHCVVFKVKGQLKCHVIKPTSPSSSIWTTTNKSIQMSDQFNKTGERTGSHDDNSTMIAGAIAGVIGFVIIVIAVVVVMRKRSKRYHVPKRPNFVENDCYGLGVDASLRFVVAGERRSQNEKEHDSFATNLNREIPRAVSQRLYNIEDREYAVPYKTGTKPQASSDVPICDALKRPKYPKTENSKNETQSVPFYKPFVLEERHAAVEDNEFQELPEYRVLEGPFSEGASVHAFSEGLV